MKPAIIVLALAMASWSGAAFPQDKPAFVFTAIPDQDETRLVERFIRVAEHLQSKLGMPVKYLPVKSYPAAVTAFTNGQVQLAWFGGFTGVQARRQVAGSEAIAQGAEDVAFKSFFIANAKTGLTPSKEFPKQIAGKTFNAGPAETEALLSGAIDIAFIGPSPSITALSFAFRDPKMVPFAIAVRAVLI